MFYILEEEKEKGEWPEERKGDGGGEGERGREEG